jgi:hypothetical protein
LVLTLPWPALASRLREESLKLVWLRLFVGLLLIYRESLNAAVAFFDPEVSSLVPASLLFIGVGALLVAGIGTRLCYIVVSVAYVRYNFELGVMNLGPLLFVPLCWAGAALDREPRYSVDRWIIARSGVYRRWAGWPGTVSLESYNFVFVILFVIYAVNSAAALTYHLRDDYWQSGQTVQAMLTNNFLSRYFETFRAIERRSPQMLTVFSVASIVIQTVFQLLMLPLAFHRWGRWFVVLQGFAFFLVSVVFLQISLLPFIELAMWGLVFGSWMRHPREQPTNVRIAVSAPRATVLAAIVVASVISLGHTAARALGMTPRNQRAPIERALIYLCIWPPDVFNETDLRMGENWYVIYRIGRDGAGRQLVPVFSEAGSRLYYHLSDLVYFGNTLVWRRGSAIVSDWSDPFAGYLLRRVERLCELDFRLHALQAPQEYAVYFYRDQSMHLVMTRRFLVGN